MSPSCHIKHKTDIARSTALAFERIVTTVTVK